jgi:hypothetical protein
MVRRLWIACLPLVIDATCWGHCFAQTEDAAAPSPRTAPVVELIVIGATGEATSLIGVVSELLGSIGVATEAHAVATPADALTITRGTAAARVEVDVRDAHEAVLVTEGRGQSPTRRLLHRDPAATVAREELAQAIESAVQAHLLAERAQEPSSPDGGTRPPDPIPPAPPPAVAAPPAVVLVAPPPASPPLVAVAPPAPDSLASHAAVSSIALDISALAGGGWFASGTGAVTDVGGEASLAWRRGWRPSVSLAARAVLPFDDSAVAVTGHASVVALRALAGLELVRGSFVSLAIGGGGGADVMSVQPESAVLAPSVLGAGTTKADPILTAFVVTHVALVSGVTLTVMAVGDVDLAPTQYLVKQGTASDSVMVPGRVRPTVLAGFTFTAFGPPAFSASGAR